MCLLLLGDPARRERQAGADRAGLSPRHASGRAARGQDDALRRHFRLRRAGHHHRRRHELSKPLRRTVRQVSRFVWRKQGLLCESACARRVDNWYLLVETLLLTSRAMDRAKFQHHDPPRECPVLDEFYNNCRTSVWNLDH